MVLGVVGRIYRGGPLAASKHAAVVRASDGVLVHKGADTPFVLRPLARGDKIRLNVDMRARELTLELIDSTDGAIGCAATIERIPNEVTVAVGFASSAAAAPQRVRLLSCVSDRPPNRPVTPRMALWEDENVQTPLHQRATYKNLLSWRSRAPVHCVRPRPPPKQERVPRNARAHAHNRPSCRGDTGTRGGFGGVLAVLTGAVASMYAARRRSWRREPPDSSFVAVQS